MTDAVMLLLCTMSTVFTEPGALDGVRYLKSSLRMLKLR